MFLQVLGSTTTYVKKSSSTPFLAPEEALHCIVGSVVHRSGIAVLQHCQTHYGHFKNMRWKSIKQNQRYHLFLLHTFFFLAYITQNATEPLSDIMGGNFNV